MISFFLQRHINIESITNDTVQCCNEQNKNRTATMRKISKTFRNNGKHLKTKWQKQQQQQQQTKPMCVVAVNHGTT